MLFSPPRNRAICSTFWGGFLTKLHSKPGEKGKVHWRKFKKIHWRRRPEIADCCPLAWSKRVLIYYNTIQDANITQFRGGLPGQVWKLRFLPSFPSFPRENRSSNNVWEAPGSLRESSSQSRDWKNTHEGLLGSSGGFGRNFPEGGLGFLEVALVWKFSIRNPSEANF